MSSVLRLSWREQVSLTTEDSHTRVVGPCSRFTLREPRREIIAAIERLTSPGEDEEVLAESVLAAGGTELLAHWFYCVKELGRRGLVERSLCIGDTRLATLVLFGEPLTNGHAPRRSRRPTARHVLSRFAYLRRQGVDMVVESPLAHARVILHEPALVAVIAALATPATAAQLGQYAADIPAAAVARLVELLVENQMMETVDNDGSQQAPDAWEFHDLLFHSRSRRGRSDAPFGGSYRLAHRPPPPAVACGGAAPAPATGGQPQSAKSDFKPEIIPLYRPNLEQLMRDDPPLAVVQERRRSIREYAAKPLSVKQLGEFLFRVARVKRRWSSRAKTPTGETDVDFASRPYPSGGALYELEFYLVVRACEGLAGGLYRYHPVDHDLIVIAHPSCDTDALLDEAAASAGMAPQSLQVLLILTARHERIAWKYESIAYALVLKHVGVVYQTMYLAATAMNLAPCALGCGDADRFARASGMDYFAETSVGEFLLGSLSD